MEYTLCRGQNVTEDEFAEKVFKKILDNKVQSYDIKKKLKQLKMDCSGTYFHNQFRVLDRDIHLTALGFYGPWNGHDGSDAEYKVDIEVLFCKPNKLPTPLNFIPVFQNAGRHFVKKGEIFWVSFHNPIWISKGTWTEIQFMLNGPETDRCYKTHEEIVVETEDGPLNFQLSPGSKQMPCLKFTI